MNLLAKTLRRVSSKLALVADQVEHDLSRHSVTDERDCFETVRELMRFHKPRRLCDIGAHCGSWARMLRHFSPSLEHAVLIEPQKNLSARLKDAGLPGIDTHVYECCVGAHSGVGVLKGGSPSASLLPVTEEQARCFPQSVNDFEETVQIRTLDEIYSTDSLPQPDLIKLDVQGFELNALQGATSVLQRTNYLVIELSCRLLYSGQNTLAELLEFLDERRFVLVARGYEWKAQVAPHELLQWDGIFMNMNGR